MLANQMKFQVLLLYDKMFELGAPAYDDEQISKILTEAQLNVVSRNIAKFESSESVRRNLDQFIKSASISGATISVSADQVGIHPNGIFYDLPTDFSEAIEETGKLTDTTVEIGVLPVTHDFYTKNISNPYKKPWAKLMWRMDFSRLDHGEDGGDAQTGQTAKRTELIHDGTGILDYRLRYLIDPPAIVTDETTPANQRHCILDDTLHYDIIREAVRILTGATEPEEYQIADNEQKKNES